MLKIGELIFGELKKGGAMVISLVNNKGGVGKTTSAVNLSACLASKHYKTLLIDLDSQASASFSLGFKRDNLSPSLDEVLFDGKRIEETIRKTGREYLDIITASKRLFNFDLIYAENDSRPFILKTVLDRIKGQYDFILIDCPPSLSLLPVNALLASEGLLIPLTPSYLSLEGLISLLRSINEIENNFKQPFNVVGIFFTITDYRNASTSEIIDLIRSQYKKLIFSSEIRINVKLAEAPSFSKSIFEYDPSSTGSLCYQSFTDEFLKRIKHIERG